MSGHGAWVGSRSRRGLLAAAAALVLAAVSPAQQPAEDPVAELERLRRLLHASRLRMEHLVDLRVRADLGHPPGGDALRAALPGGDQPPPTDPAAPAALRREEARTAELQGRREVLLADLEAHRTATAADPEEAAGPEKGPRTASPGPEEAPDPGRAPPRPTGLPVRARLRVEALPPRALAALLEAGLVEDARRLLAARGEEPGAPAASAPFLRLLEASAAERTGDLSGAQRLLEEAVAAMPRDAGQAEVQRAREEGLRFALDHVRWRLARAAWVPPAGPGGAPAGDGAGRED